MARCVFINAELRGSIAGQTYSRNRGGAFVRARVTPTNPSSGAQVRARDGFLQASRAWMSLSQDDKAAWAGFAEAIYKPKHPKIGVSLTGANAYVALLQSQVQLTALNRSTTLAAPAGASLTFANTYNFSGMPSGLFFLGTWTDAATNTPIYLSMTSATISNNALFSAVIAFDHAVAAADVVTKDFSRGCEVGFAFFVSESNRPYRSDRICVGATLPITAITGATGSINSVKLQFSSTDLDLDKYVRFILPDTRVRVTAYATSVAGEQVLIGSDDVNVDKD
jgi:hypothetical protein